MHQHHCCTFDDRPVSTKVTKEFATRPVFVQNGKTPVERFDPFERTSSTCSPIDKRSSSALDGGNLTFPRHRTGLQHGHASTRTPSSPSCDPFVRPPRSQERGRILGTEGSTVFSFHLPVCRPPPQHMWMLGGGTVSRPPPLLYMRILGSLVGRTPTICPPFVQSPKNWIQSSSSLAQRRKSKRLQPRWKHSSGGVPPSPPPPTKTSTCWNVPMPRAG